MYLIHYSSPLHQSFLVLFSFNKNSILFYVNFSLRLEFSVNIFVSQNQRHFDHYNKFKIILVGLTSKIQPGNALTNNMTSSKK